MMTNFIYSQMESNEQKILFQAIADFFGFDSEFS